VSPPQITPGYNGLRLIATVATERSGGPPLEGTVSFDKVVGCGGLDGGIFPLGTAKLTGNGLHGVAVLSPSRSSYADPLEAPGTRYQFLATYNGDALDGSSGSQCESLALVGSSVATPATGSGRNPTGVVLLGSGAILAALGLSRRNRRSLHKRRARTVEHPLQRALHRSIAQTHIDTRLTR